MTKKANGLTYTIADIDAGHMVNIDMMASDDTKVATTARLAKELVNVIDVWLESEGDRETDIFDMMVAAMHGTTTICGTMLLQADPKKRKKIAAVMRSQALAIFDAMESAVRDEP